MIFFTRFTKPLKKASFLIRIDQLSRARLPIPWRNLVNRLYRLNTVVG